MTKAEFKHVTPKGKTITGIVTLKDDGKISLNLDCASRFSSIEKYAAKNVANAIVAANFNHPDVISCTSSNKALVTKLEAATQDLLNEYIDKTIVYAKQRFEQCEERRNWNYAQWVAAYQVGTSVGAILSRQGDAERTRVYSITNGGYNAYEAKQIKMANDHYQMSILKLADRLHAKGITDDFEITRQRLGVNFEIVIKHPNGKYTKAWTIIASGPIQCPHYRFLVK
jgi:hypothetical protein